MNCTWHVLVATLILGVWTPPQAQTPKAEKFPAVGEPAIITVSSAGAAPRTPLRYRVPASYRGRMEMTMAMGMAMNMDGNAMPPVDVPPLRMVADVAVTSVATSGDVSYTFAFVSMDADDPAVRAAVQQVASALADVKGTMVINNRGETKSAAFDASKIANPQMRQTMSSAFESMRSMSLPLPEEPVGAGARWQVRQSMVSNGIQSTQTIDVELVSANAGAATLKIATVQHAPVQKVTLPDLPGATVNLQKLDGTGTGTVNIALDGLIPTSEMTSRTNTVMDIEMGGTRQNMAMDVTLTLKVAPGK
jgi:hypothetical protein